MSRIRYEDLSGDDVNAAINAGILNGCGPSSKFGIVEWLIPEFIFTPACYVHDFEYWVGGTSEDRYEANSRFLRSMLNISRMRRMSGKIGRFAHFLYRILASRYFKAVHKWTKLTDPRKQGFRYGRAKSRVDFDKAVDPYRYKYVDEEGNGAHPWKGRV